MKNLFNRITSRRDIGEWQMKEPKQLGAPVAAGLLVLAFLILAGVMQ